MPFPARVFKAYDIRGLSPAEIDENFAYRLGCVFPEYAKARIVVVGRDTRQTSPAIAAALVDGLLTGGAKIVEVGLVSTPLFYFGVAKDHAHEAGIMVTASHNPASYNGFKLVRAGAGPIGGQEMQTIRRLMEESSGTRTRASGRQIAVLDVKEDYLKTLFSLVEKEKIQGLRLGVDAGNGMAGVILPQLFERLSVEVFPLYLEPDGTFPHHEANPLKEETLKELKTLVRNQQAHLGAAYDGDADRVGLVDETGTSVPADLLATLLVSDLLRQHPGSTVLFDLRSSRVYQEEVERLGGRAVMSRVGHSFIKSQLKESGAVFAFELAGHYYFKNFPGVECPDLFLLMVLARLAAAGRSLSELIAPFKKYFHSGEINFEVADKERIIEELERQYGSQGKLIKIDGLRVDFDEWWFSVRPSNTEPLLRLNLEAASRELMEEKRAELSELIEIKRLS